MVAGQHALDLHDGAWSDPSLLGLARRYADLGLSWEEVRREVRRETFTGVLLHEIGHTVGLRHNFAGSFDAWNYHPSYWDLRRDGDMGPRHTDPETDAETDGRIREFQYSSVMDYGGAINSDWHGLGHYDHAAVKFGYGGLVSVHTEVPQDSWAPGLGNRTVVSYVSTYNSFSAFPSPVLWLNSGEILELHYTDYAALAGDLEARVDVPLEHLEPTGGLEDQTGFAQGFRVATTVPGLVEAGDPAVPFRFCSDEFAVGLTCDRWDEGADPWEAQEFLMQRYTNGYLLDNFQRGRYGFGDPSSYLRRKDGRVFEPLGVWQRYYALLHGAFDADNDPFVRDFFAADKGFGGWTAANDAQFQFLAQVILRPEPGAHEHMYRPDGTLLLAPTWTAGTVDIPLVTGAYYESDWDYESGYHWFDRQSRIGTYWDRMLALLSLTYTDAYGFLGYDTSSDPKAYSIGYQDLYRDQIALLLGQLMSDEMSSLAPVLDEQGQLIYPDTTAIDRSWPPAGLEDSMVQPASYWLVQYDAGLFGKALLAQGYDRSFLNRSRVYLEGHGTAIDAAEGVDTVSYVDRTSGKTYVAWSFPALDGAGEPVLDAEGRAVELGSSARMLQQAIRLDALCSLDSVAPYTDPLDDVSMEEQADVACAALESLAGDIDLQLQLYNHFDQSAG